MFSCIKMTGLPNLGNSCYINSVLQCLRYQRHFVRMLKNYDSKKDSKFHQEFIDLMFADASDKILRDFVFKLSHESSEFKLFKQCDAHELFLFLIDNFYEKHKMTNPFLGTFQSKIFCDCGYESVTEQEFVSISVNVGKNTSEMLDNYQKTEELDIACKCSKKLKKKMTLTKKPDILVVHLKRFSNANNKINDQIYFEPPKCYKLTAICNHSGQTHSGHYTAAVLKGHGGWKLCNDIHIEELPHLPEKSNLPYILFFERYKRKISDIK